MLEQGSRPKRTWKEIVEGDLKNLEIKKARCIGSQ